MLSPEELEEAKFKEAMANGLSILRTYVIKLDSFETKEECLISFALDKGLMPEGAKVIYDKDPDVIGNKNVKS